MLLSLHAAFDQNGKKAQGFVMAQEPSKNDQAQHNIWAALRISPLFDYVDISESERIIAYAEENNVHPLLQEIKDEEEESPF